jgi:hypothetical protein
MRECIIYYDSGGKGGTILVEHKQPCAIIPGEGRGGGTVLMEREHANPGRGEAAQDR